MLYLLSCGFLSWTNRFSNLTTNTATSCSLLFAFFPRYSTWFLAFITYSATLSPLFFAFYACYSTWSFHTFLWEKIFSHVLCILCCSSRKFGTTRILFSSISLGALSSLLRTLLVLVLPQAAPMQGECLGTNQTDIMARPASPTTWPGLTLHTYRLFIHVQTWQSQIPSLDKELQCVLTYHMDS